MPKLPHLAEKSFVTHFGPAPDGPGGMSSAIETYLRLELVDYLPRSIITYHPANRFYSLLPFLKAAWKLVSAPRQRLGIAHFHLSKGGSFVREGILLLAAHFRGIPTCATLHSGGFPQFQRSHPWIVRVILSHADRVLVLSSVMRDYVRQISASTTALVTPNIVTCPAESSKPSQCRPLVIFGGDVSPEKGIDTLLNCWPDVLLHVPEAQLLIAGPIRTFPPRSLPRVQWLGHIPRLRIYSLLLESRVAVLPSRREGMPMFVLEAMACGRPVVATNVGTLPELLRGCGTVVPVGQSQQLADSIAKYLMDPLRADQDGFLARQRIELEHSPTILANSLTAVYDSLRDCPTSPESGAPRISQPSSLK